MPGGEVVCVFGLENDSSLVGRVQGVGTKFFSPSNQIIEGENNNCEKLLPSNGGTWGYGKTLTHMQTDVLYDS